MHCYGGTIGASTSPFFWDGEELKMLPRPFTSCRPGSNEFQLMRETWFQDLTADIEQIVINFLEYEYPRRDKAFKTLNIIEQSKTLVPSC